MLIPMQIDLATRITYGTTLTSAKASVLMLYRRLFPLRTTWFRIAWWANIIFVTAYYVAFITHLLARCRPLTRLWSHQHRCDSSLFSGEMFGAFNAAIDLTILVLPIRMVWGLHLPKKQKVAVCGIFLLGLMYGFVLLGGKTVLILSKWCYREHHPSTKLQRRH